MKILICGAQGFIGRHISLALQKAGHEVCHGVRRPQAVTGTGPAEIAIDYAHDTDPAIWETRLRQLGQVDVVINAVGILNETSRLRFDAIHRDAPVALFRAAEKCGVKSVVQISALGGRQEAEHPDIMTGYMQSKRAADNMLMESGLTYLVLRPSLVVGVDGGSSQLFRILASLPVLGLPGRGEQQVQPVHMDDLCTAINIWLANATRSNLVLNAVGPQAMSYRRMLEIYRQAMGMPAQTMFPIPMSVMRVSARLATLLPQTTLTPDSLDMLEQDNVADAQPFAAHLHRPAISHEDWFAGIPANMLASTAIAAWSLPLFRYVLALVWFVTAALSFGIYPISGSLALLQPLGLSGAPAMFMLMAASSLDLCLGLATLFWPRRILWLMQIALIVGYSCIIAIYSPEYYLHPFGPVLKNLPILALLAFLFAHQRDAQ
ncbi:SDR family oxidoreductase [Undibacterium sp. CY18W]|uniref:SDR family oxidoreductase n=1 Tax=Undibacterium hunanense TaxID=2762292 RepID=A0ABR6ZV20_9BURK|nr:SDR family oxidoreductase [Undibacterium hunanense]MBC3919712.1 SDR family oxidoreductase [Undibacterium hunanense]